MNSAAPPPLAANDQQRDATSESVSMVVQHRVRVGAQEAYRNWLVKIMLVAASFPGHQGVHVVHPPAGGVDYTIVVRFSTREAATRWHRSEERSRLIDAVQPLLEVAEEVSVGAGIDYWFQPAASSEASMKAPAWKQWLITTSVIWPLTMVVPWAFEPVFKALPALGAYGVAHGILAAVIVAIVVWLIMPRYTLLVHDWLFRKK